MSYDTFKAAILRTIPAEPKTPLEEPPVESLDLIDVQCCPACGCTDAVVKQVEDAEVASCPQCQCEFSPVVEAVSKTILRRISEHRQRRINRLIEEMPNTPPPGIDPKDFDLLRQIVNNDLEDGEEPNKIA